jgi:hypothetical protein
MNSATETSYSRKIQARLAGLLYFLSGLPAVFSLQYVHHRLMNHENGSATFANIVASEKLFRLGIVSELLSAVFFMFLGFTLYRLLKPVNRSVALLMLSLVLVSIPISFLNELNNIAALVITSGANFLSAFTKPQLDSLLMFFLNLHMDGVNVVQIFWGLWLFPFGILVYKSGFLPRFLGALLVLGCFAYAASSLTWLISPANGNAMFFVSAAVGGFAEGLTGLWLLIAGAKDSPQSLAAA